MNSRERLQRITKEANDAGRVAACSDNDAAALRELDQLCQDMRDCIHYWYDSEKRLDILKRAAQAGYGDK